jgi:arginine deiminase
VTFIDHRLAAVRNGKASADLLKVLREAGIEAIPCDVEPGAGEPFANNFVTVSPGEIVMPAGCPATRRRLESAGIVVDEIDVSQYLRGAGGIGCLTAILHRA